jgi:hypothetical protein
MRATVTRSVEVSGRIRERGKGENEQAIPKASVRVSRQEEQVSKYTIVEQATTPSASLSSSSLLDSIRPNSTGRRRQRRTGESDSEEAAVTCDAASRRDEERARSANTCEEENDAREWRSVIGDLNDDDDEKKRRTTEDIEEHADCLGEALGEERRTPSLPLGEPGGRSGKRSSMVRVRVVLQNVGDSL